MKIKSQKILLSLTIMSCLTFTACGHEHIFSDATCDSAPTCECGEIQGEALGHSFSEPTCTDAKLCGICGAIDGEPLGHTWLDATETAPKTCELCGETEGEPLEPITDSTGHDAVFEEGDYIEPVEEENTSGPLTIDETIDYFRGLYEQGLISEEQLNEFIAIGEGQKAEEDTAPSNPSTPGHIDVDVPGVSEDTGNNSGKVWTDPDLPDWAKGDHMN